MPNDVIHVDLDTNEMTVPEGMHIPELPEPDATQLKVKRISLYNDTKLFYAGQFSSRLIEDDLLCR